MGKKEPKIMIKVADEPPDPNTTFSALLRDGEKFKPGDARGTLMDRLGAVFQEFMRGQMAAAEYKRSAVKGKVVLTFDFTTGPDGSQTYTCDEKITAAKLPKRASMTFTDEDGEMTGRPAEPLTDEMYRRERAAKNDTKATEPKVGAPSNL
ncbi:MAG TPA: hypothetical protein VFS09_06495 [Candidatus Eisenbacteria bacterium]|nr:hypothetical protein [Candidatus Eisenbacteria bacterium]